MHALGPTEAAVVTSRETMFPGGTSRLPKLVSYQGQARHEYLKLVARQLRAGKLELTDAPSSAAGVFAIAKKTEGHQREIWNGAQISAAATPPPRPPLPAPLPARSRPGRSPRHRMPR